MRAVSPILNVKFRKSGSSDGGFPVSSDAILSDEVG